MKNFTEQLQKKRRFLLVLPLLTLLFVTLAFWALGGGQAPATTAQTHKGLNPELPGAQTSIDPQDKMSLYTQAEQEAAKRLRESSLNPYPGDSTQTDTSEPLLIAPGPGQVSKGWQPYTDPNEARVQKKLKELEIALSSRLPTDSGSAEHLNPASAGLDSDMQRLEQLIKSASAPAETDPEIGQLDSMLDKIIDIQHPGREAQRLKELSLKNKGRVYTVNKKEEQTEADIIEVRGYSPSAIPIEKELIPVNIPNERNSFYSLTADSEAFSEPPTAIPAVVHETQTLLNGATIKMRLLEDIMINGINVPAGSFVYGNCAISGERLLIEIPSIRSGSNLFPVTMATYDLDGLEGIRIPGAISRDVSKEGADKVVQSLQFMPMESTVVSQAASAGIEVAKGLFSKKMTLIRVTVKAGYPVLLLDAKAKQELQ